MHCYLRKFPSHVLNLWVSAVQLGLRWLFYGSIPFVNPVRAGILASQIQKVYPDNPQSKNSTEDIRCRQTFICYKWFFIIELHGQRQERKNFNYTPHNQAERTEALSAEEPIWVGVGKWKMENENGCSEFA